MFSSALILETNNLRGGGAAKAKEVVASLKRLLLHLREQSMPLATLEDLIVTHDGLAQEERCLLSEAAGVAIKWVELPPNTPYYQAKNIGFAASAADVVVFADSDCWPDNDWLHHMLTPFEESECRVVAGLTTYRDDVLGNAATTIDFLYFPSPLGKGTTRNFYANNVAFRREVFAQLQFPEVEGMYRGHCQVLGMQLLENEIPVRLKRAAHTVHRFPDAFQEFLQLRLLRGADLDLLTPELARNYLRGGHIKANPVLSSVVLAGRLGFSLREVGRGSAKEMLPCAATVLAISMLDFCGLLSRRLLGREEGQVTLSYHRDGDRLGAAN